ncbi:hypothetical protein FQN60_008497 [Etheostoma spectabile]|uniref:Fibronectin type-III domain-containing protein n=1 Tax=Etheostoma spectabile TaxID=54343 RepID=A0A5J5CRB5_9PERO|nr:hypothetical protein FQN60_008497 [Etheostoma spectabile]
MGSERVLQLLALAFLGSALPARVEADSYLAVVPQSPVLEVGTNFTATCVITNTSEVTADDLYWTLSETTVPMEQYTKINESALNVTVTITGEESEWLLCKCKKKDVLFFFLNEGKLVHGIQLKKGYAPGKPENLSCEAVQQQQYISTTFSCKWQPVGRQTAAVPTSYTLYATVVFMQTYNKTTQTNRASVKLGDTFPHHMTLEVWVEAHNKLGKIESEHLKEYSGWFVKPDPPLDVKVFSEKTFPTSLLINWTHLIPKERVKLTYQIRYRQNGTQNWTYVPPWDTATDIKSFRLQGLQPYQVYETQVSCKNARQGRYWSDWSTMATERTPEAQRAPVEELKVWPHSGQLWLEWKPPFSTEVSEYVVEWVSEGQTDWQKEKRNTRSTAIKAPSERPVVRLQDKPGRNQALLVWTEIPQGSRRGFITNYTIFYTSGSETHEITVPANTTSYTLESLSGNTKYDTWIKASTIGGSVTSFNHSFTTLIYAPGEMEGIVVGIHNPQCFPWYRIKENFWPPIPDPGESTIGNWSPEYPLKEDKAGLPLKKDKYLSEEHSSGIGGSSCMSSPRQSVSDSDEGGDMADTTASTVQYSSVVAASSGYKGQTPNAPPQQAFFSRSESTQPLLDSEENPDMLQQEGSRQSQRFPPRLPRFTDDADPAGIAEQQELLEPLDFCPLGEDSERETSVDSQAPLSSYMPQLGGLAASLGKRASFKASGVMEVCRGKG